MNMNVVLQSAGAMLLAVAWKVAGAFILWLVGRWLIALAGRVMGRAMATLP
jgi:hypothetical protein